MSRSDRIAVARTLAASAHFAALGDPERRGLTEACTVSALPARAMPVRSRQFWIVLTGALQVGLKARGGELTYAVLGAGSFYGANAVVGEIGPATLVRTIAPTTLASVPQARLVALGSEMRSLRDHLETLAMRRVVNAEYIFADAALLPARARIARRLLMQALAGNHDRSLEGCEVIVTHEILAQMVGLSRTRLEPELAALEREGVIRRAYRRIVVLDPEALEAAALRPVEPL